MADIIDVRTNAADCINKIIFSEVKPYSENAWCICRGDKYKAIISADSSVNIKTEQDAKNLIKALQKAIELNWWK